MEPYTYRPLNRPQQIRMMILEPAKERSAPLNCALIHQDLDGESFEALSYVWGSIEDLQMLHCEGKTIRITKNLDQALRGVRRKRDEVRLWVDAVCINQPDIDEKSVQIKLMAQIYSIAKHCVIWLDPKENISGWAVMAMKVSHALFRPDERKYFFQAFSKPRRYEFLLSKVFLARRRSVQVIESLCACEWFYRLWTFQELLMNKAPRIVFQCHSIPWRTVYQAMLAIDKYGRTDRDRAWRFHCWERFQPPLDYYGRGEIAYDLRRLQATQTADQVIGAKAILERLVGHDISLGYHQTVPELFTTVSRALLSLTRELKFLLSAAIYKSTPGLPSWCIDWSNWSEQGEVLRHNSQYWFSRSRDNSLKQWDYKENVQDSEAMQIELRGSKLGSVLAHAGPVSVEEAQNIAAVSLVAQRSDRLRKAVWPLLSFFKSHETTILSIHHQLEMITRYIAPCGLVTADLERLLEQSRDPEFFSRLDLEARDSTLRILTRQSFFVMDNGHLGRCWCAVEIVEGDMMFAPAKEQFLVVLRPVDGQEHLYKYLGPAIVHGLEDEEGKRCCDDRIELGEEINITLI